MPDTNPEPIANSDDIEVRAHFENGVRCRAQQFAKGAVGVAGVATVVVLAASGFLPLLPLITAGGPTSNVVLSWLAGLGGNALAGWLANWASKEGKHLLHGDEIDELVLLKRLAEALESEIATNSTLRDELAMLIEQTSNLTIAFAALETKVEAQTNLLEALRSDLRRNDLIQGRLHRLLARELHQLEARIREVVRNELQPLRRVRSPFTTQEGFFNPLLDPKSLFNHTLSLVGRSDVLEQLHEFVQSKQYQVAILPGRGGIGKSKVLQTFAQDFDECYQDLALWFVSEGIPITNESLNDVPATCCVLIIDDAYRRNEDLLLLLESLRVHSPTLASFSLNHVLLGHEQVCSQKP